MTAAKGAQKNKDQTTKSVTWFGKWIPDNFAKKAQEAFKLLERAIFSDEYVDDKEQLKIKKLENQLKSLQDKVDQLANIKPTRPASTSSTQSVKKATSKDKTKVTSQNKEPPAQTRIQIRVPDSPKHNKKIPPPPPPPVKVVSVMTSSSATVVSGHTVPPRPPPPAQPAVIVKALPFSASDLQGFSFKTRSQTGLTPVKPIVPVLTHTAPVTRTLVGKSPARPPVVRAAMKPFSSTDLRLVKLKNKSKDTASVNINSATNKPPKTPSNKSHIAKNSKPVMSMRTAIKNALKSKFHKAQGSPGGKSDDEEEDEVDWSK